MSVLKCWYLCKLHHSASFLLNFPLKLGGQKMWARRDYFPPYFLSLLFSLLNQTMENVIFHHIFLSLFSIFPFFTPTKHNLKSENRFYFGPCHQPSNRKCIRGKRNALADVANKIKKKLYLAFFKCHISI